MGASLRDHVPVIPHSSLSDVSCPGVLVVEERAGRDVILCNECGTIFRIVAPGHAESAMRELADLPDLPL